MEDIQMSFSVFFINLVEYINFKYIPFFLIFLALIVAILILKRKINRLKKEKHELKLQNEGLEHNLIQTKQERDYLSQRKQEARDYWEEKTAIKTDFIDNPEEYCYLKNSCMSKNESRFFYFINCALNELFNQPYRDDFIVFPQVSIHAFIGFKNDDSSLKSDVSKQNLLAKNIDYLICQRYKKDNYYLYRPYIVIELDGKSHYQNVYGQHKFNKQQVSDTIKNNLFSELGVPLIRYRMATDTVIHADRSAIKEELRKIVQIKENG